MSDTSVKKAIMKKIQEEMDNGWSQRDALPTGDPIGDVDESQDEYISGHKKWAKDQETYNEMMRGRLLNPKGKNFSMKVPKAPDYVEINLSTPAPTYSEPKCDCGVAKTYKNPSLKMHSTWCELRSNNDC